MIENNNPIIVKKKGVANKARGPVFLNGAGFQLNAGETCAALELRKIVFQVAHSTSQSRPEICATWQMLFTELPILPMTGSNMTKSGKSIKQLVRIG